MFSSVLIANRGEIACRIARTARRMGLRTVAVYSDADARALHVRVCDEAHAIGPAPAAESYLSIARLIEAARRARVDCIHPGYGFLSENAAFAEACAAAGIAFVGPPPAAIRAMGLKDRAKALMDKAGVPVVPGYHGERQEAAFLRQKAYETGYPVLIKAVAGGGGKGMRRVDRHAEFEAALESAQREAQAAFGDPRVLIEKCVTSPRHVEVQVFADAHGNAIHLGERDCSLQRRHQKVIEEAPAPGMDNAMRAALGAAAVRAVQAVNYVGAGTVEFIADGADALKPEACWFMEMNTRLQVEHPVTEAVTGLDLVEWQFRIAAGEPLPLAQDGVTLTGHAVEARLYAEDPARGFLPSTGRLAALRFPAGEGLRIDAGVEEGDAIGPHYDPMIAKLVAHAPTREAALAHLASALERTLVAGPYTNSGFLAKLCRAPEFVAGRFDTGFIERHREALMPQGPDLAAAASGVLLLLCGWRERMARPAYRVADAPASPWDADDGFQLSGRRIVPLAVLVDGHPRTAELRFGPGGCAASVGGVAPDDSAFAIEAAGAVYVMRHGRQTVVALSDPATLAADDGERGGAVRAPMHGRLSVLLVSAGDRVTRGQRLAIIEAMKMEHALAAPRDGLVADLSVPAGAQVAEGAILMTVQPDTLPDEHGRTDPAS